MSARTILERAFGRPLNLDDAVAGLRERGIRVPRGSVIRWVNDDALPDNVVSALRSTDRPSVEIVTSPVLAASLTELDDLALDADHAAAAILEELGITGRAAELLLSPVRIWCAARRRPVGGNWGARPGGTRREPALNTVGLEALFSQTRTEAQDTQLTRLLACTFTLEASGRLVNFGDATADEHETQAEALADKAAGLLGAAVHHRQAAALKTRRRPPLLGCGTRAVFLRHRAAGEDCDVCEQASRNYHARRRVGAA